MTFGANPFGVAPLGASVTGEAPAGVDLAGSAQANASASATFTETGSITLTDFVNRRVFQRVGTSKSMSIAGTYTGSPTSIQARVVQDGTSTEVVTWTTIVDSPSGGTFSGSLSVPQGGWYNVQVRFGNDTGTTDAGTNQWGVGILALIIGQSQMSNWFDVGVHAVTPLASRQSGSVYGGSSGTWSALATTGNGANEFATQMIAQYGIPIGLLSYAVGGTAIASWDDVTDAYHRQAVKAVQDVGGEIEYICWAQGEADGSAGTTYATYISRFTTMVSNFRSEITNRSTKTNLPFLTSTLGRGTSIGTDAQASAIRKAQYAAADSIADVYIAASALDLPLADAAHYTSAGYVTHGARFANAVKHLLGDAAYSRGPTIASAMQIDSTTTDVTITHRGGTDFTPTTAINGFELDDGGTIVVPSAAVRQSATVIRLTHSAISASATLRYGYGADGGDTFAATISNILVDNTALALPLEQPESIALSLGLAANAVSTSYASGTLTVFIPLDAIAIAQASVTGILTTQIPLSGAAAAAALASGSLLGGAIDLAGAAVSVAYASGTLTVNIALTAQALASAIASGSLTAQILLDADAAAQAQAGAELSGGSGFVLPAASTRTVISSVRRPAALSTSRR